MPSIQGAIDIAVNLWKAERLDEAAGVLDNVLQQVPDEPLALYLLGSIHLHKNAPATAIVLLERAVREDPSADWAWHNLGIAYKQLQDTERAEKCYMRALKLNPSRSDTMAMVSGCYVNQGNPEPALEWADKALSLDPDDPHSKNHKALALLELGRWSEGWDCWMNRWEVPERQKMRRNYGEQWTGGPVDGTIVVHGEQGLGDEILYMSCFDRFLEEVGPARVVIESATRLVPLFKRSFRVPVYGTEEEVKKNEKIDFYVSMGDLPARYLRSDEDFKKQPHKYIYADPMRVEYWKKRLGPTIGIAWWGGLAKTHSKHRNAPISFWKDLVKSPGNFVSVQYETGDTEKEAEKIGVPHFPEAVADFDDHLALIDACDMVITVCQTAHHTAGALGKPCRTLVPHARAFRYGDGQSIWYPSVFQCNQGVDGDWTPAFEQIKAELKLAA